MGDIGRTLFGGAESKATSTPINFTDSSLQGLNPILAAALKTTLGSFSGQQTNAGNPGTATPTPQAPVTGQEQDILNSIGSSVGGGTARAGYINDVLSGKYLPTGDNSNPFVSAAITAASRPALDALTQTLTRDLPGRFTANGQMIQSNTNGQGGSSAFDRAAALATQSTSNMLTDIASKIGSDAYTNERNQQTQAASLDQNEVNTAINALSASALPRLIQQNGLDQGLALFQQQTQNLLALLKTIGAVGSPTLANQSESTATKENGIIPALFPKGL